ncbi:MAG: ABC transporter permease [Gloeobacterales cyanobacterium]
MDILESIKMAATTLIANKLRSSLTMLGIIIGIASVIAMIGIGEGAQKLAAEQFESLGPNVLFITAGTQSSRRHTTNLPKTLVLDDAKAIATEVPSITSVAPQINARALVVYRNKSLVTGLVGATPSFLPVRSFDVARGRFLSDDDVKRDDRVVALGSELAQKLFGNQNPIGQQIRIKNVSFLVIGVMQAKGSFLGNNQDDVAYLPLSTMASRIVGRTSPYGIELTFIAASAKNESSIRAAQFQITNLLRLRHKITIEDDFNVQTQKDVLDIIGNITGGLTIMLGAIAGISLLVGGIGIMNIMLVSVTERTHEIGLRKAVGASQQDILIQFMIEAVILSAVGGLIGTLIGSGATLLIALFSPLKATISPLAILISLTVSCGIGLFFGVFPARQAAKLDPIVALRGT